jgi:hypothetical protein
MPEREPIMEEERMSAGKAIAVEKCSSAHADVRETSVAEATARKAGMAEATAREAGMPKATAGEARMRKPAVHSTKSAVSAKSVSAKSAMATAAAVPSSRGYRRRRTGNESRRCGQRDHCLAHRHISTGCAPTALAIAPVPVNEIGVCRVLQPAALFGRGR